VNIILTSDLKLNISDVVLVSYLRNDVSPGEPILDVGVSLIIHTMSDLIVGNKSFGVAQSV
jgi:hypothetical protein